MPRSTWITSLKKSTTTLFQVRESSKTARDALRSVLYWLRQPGPLRSFRAKWATFLFLSLETMTLNSDKTLRMLLDPNCKYVPTEVENHIILELLGDQKHWPKNFRTATFSPSFNLQDASELRATSFRNERWGVECIEPDLEYRAWVGNSDNAVSSWTPARAITAAIWLKHLKDKEDASEQ